jgi:hypothetical protein
VAGITTDQLRAHLGINPADTTDDEWLGQSVAAVNAWVATLPVVVDQLPTATPAIDLEWPADVQTGAIMLAAHGYHSRNAPYGRATLDLAGGFNQAYADPEISRYLRLRRWGKPMISGPA